LAIRNVRALTTADSARTLLAWARDPGTTHPLAAAARVAAGVVFLGFGPGKLVRHGAEASAFDRYGIPLADATTYAVGVLEIAGGAALVLGLLVRPVALVLAMNLVVAVATAGRIDGGAVNLVLAPMLIAVLAALALRGGGPRSLDRHLARPRESCSR
jgi:putative oxidoreductase